MQAHNAQIQDFMLTGKNVFVVPVYQRNYSWQNEHCRKLFNDIIQVIISGKEHFLGTICYKVTSSRERSIIDGQQRLTSISLLLKAIYDFDSSAEVRDEVNRYLYNKGLGVDTDFLRFKLHLNQRDDATYRLMLGSNHDNVERLLTHTQISSRVYQNYLEFYALVEKYAASGGSTADILEALSMLTIVELEIQQENPQEIFESLNSTGLDLTDVDLLRNYFLMQFSHEQQTKLYDKYWGEIENYVGLDRMVSFFTDYTIYKKRSDAVSVNGRRAHMTEGKLYSQFKDFFRDYWKDEDYPGIYEKTLSLFKDMLYCARIYGKFIFHDDVDLSKESPLRQKLYYMLATLDSKQPLSLLLYIFDLKTRGLIDSNTLDASLDAVAAISFRAKLCKASGLMGRQFAGSVMQRLDEIQDYSQFIDMFWRALTSGKGSFSVPSDGEFWDVLVHNDLYKALRSKGMKYLLYTLEMHSPYSKGLPSITDEHLSVEHVMPQTLNPAWRGYLAKNTMEEYESLLHRLGNLALTHYNGEMSNKSFAEKQTVYQETNLYYTRHICDYSQWQLEQIDDRSRKMADAALKIWYVPAKYQMQERAVPKSRHSLDEDAAQFTYTKPESLIVGDQVIKISYWADIPPALCRLLRRESQDAFVTIASSGRLGFFGINDDSHDYSVNPAFTHIMDGIYVRQQMSAASIITAMQRLVVDFDAACGSDYRDNIYFTIK